MDPKIKILMLQSLPLFLIKTLNDLIEGISKDDINNRDRFKGPAEKLLKLIFPNDVQDCLAENSLGTCFLSMCGLKSTMQPLMPSCYYAPIKLNYEEYSANVAQSAETINKTASPADKLAAKTIFDHVWKDDVFDYAKKHVSEYLPLDLKEHFGNKGELDAFIQRQVVDCEKSDALKEAVKQLMMPIFLRAVTLPKDEKGQEGLARVISELKGVVDKYAKTHTEVGEEDVKRIADYDASV